jgi:hypothetical protein
MPEAVRAWARRGCRTVSTHEPLPVTALEPYLARPEVDRRCATSKGIAIPGKGAVS